MENKTETVDNTNTSALVDGKPDTIQVDPMNVAQATIAFMHVQNAELNLANKKLLAENKILEIMALVGVSPKEYGYNPSTGELTKQKQTVPVIAQEPVSPVVNKPAVAESPTPVAAVNG